MGLFDSPGVQHFASACNWPIARCKEHFSPKPGGACGHGGPMGQEHGGASEQDLPVLDINAAGQHALEQTPIAGQGLRAAAAGTSTG
eukprot:1145232-Pelagomonas_calceolata.AAC.1